MKKRIFAYILCFCTFVCNSWGQSVPASPVQQINQIKRSPDEYIFAESTSQNWEAALDNAKILLTSNIEDWAKTQSAPDSVQGYVTKASEHILSIQTMRGTLYRAFVYVKKGDILHYTSNERLLIVPVEKKSGATQSANAEPSVASADTLKTEDVQLSADEQLILEVHDAQNIVAFIREMQSKNRLSRFGKYKNMPVDADCYLLIYDRDGKVPAALRKQGTRYVNLQSGADDDIANYKGCGAFWFIFK